MAQLLEGGGSATTTPGWLDSINKFLGTPGTVGYGAPDTGQPPPSLPAGTYVQYRPDNSTDPSVALKRELIIGGVLVGVVWLVSKL